MFPCLASYLCAGSCAWRVALILAITRTSSLFIYLFNIKGGIKLLLKDFFTITVRNKNLCSVEGIFIHIYRTCSLGAAYVHPTSPSPGHGVQICRSWAIQIYEWVLPCIVVRIQFILQLIHLLLWLWFLVCSDQFSTKSVHHLPFSQLIV